MENQKDNNTISCSGSEAPNDHPKVYLTTNPATNEIICPYCQKKFIKDIK